MDYEKALEIIKKYQYNSDLTPDEEFLLIEAFMYIINLYKDIDPEVMPDGYIAMFNLASLYKRREEYSLALKYFEMCSEHGGGSISDMEAARLYYDGRVGQCDYEKAFKYFSTAAQEGFPNAKLRIADMYKNGQFVKQDDEKYKELIFSVYDQICDSPVPYYKGETFLKMAKIYIDDGDLDEAFELLLSAKDELEKQLISYINNSDLDYIKQIIELQYELMQPEIDENWLFGLYDLYYILQKPVSIEFSSSSGMHYVSSVPESHGMTIEMDGKWYRSIDDYFYRATIDGERLPAKCCDLMDFKLI
ncbi:MAG: tetratricopeptide repeat protein [Anaerovoracaceae bacterium]|jgi:tetratricopeptide (TPR) repeat protein